MSLPTNSGRAKDKGCSPVSSNCVVWQGPDLDCIGVCKGDTISDVIANLALELCTIVEQFDLEGYNFSCLQVQPSEAPADLQDLIQILIDRICIIEGIVPNDPDSPLTSDCPENCIVPIAPCFQFINPQGDTITTMTLLEYVTAIGNQICDILDDITVLQNEVQTLQDIVNGNGSGEPIMNPGGIVGEIELIEATFARTSSLEYQISTLTDPSKGVQYITGALRSVENSLLSTQDAVGTPTELYQNMIKAGNIGDQARLFGLGNMNSITGWTSNVQKTAESIGNIWLAIEDIREAVSYIQENCCSTGCSDIYLNFRASIDIQPTTTFLSIFTDGSTGFTNDWKECQNDTRIRVEDSAGNTTTFRAALIPLIDVPSGFQIDITATTIDPTLDITVTAETCFTNTVTETTCENNYPYLINAVVDCPPVILTVYATSINYQFTSVAGSSYIATVYYAGGSTPVAEQIISTPGITVLNSIPGLLTATDYEFELTVYSPSGEETVCNRIPFTTLPDSCVPPINASAMLTI